MPAYIVLVRLTQKGLAGVKQQPEIIRRAQAQAEKAGIRVIGVWWTLGEYDSVAVVEAPDDLTMASALLAQSAQGDATTQTLKAFSEDEFAQIVSKLP